MSILNATHLKKYYGKDESLVKALDDVNVSVENGQFVAIIGTSGSGRNGVYPSAFISCWSKR